MLLAPERWGGGGKITSLQRRAIRLICAAPKRMVFEPLKSQKGIDFSHINVKQGAFSLSFDTECLF